MCTKLVPLSHFAITLNDDCLMAIQQGKPIKKSVFIADVGKAANYYASLPTQNIAIYYQDAYLFIVALYALLHCDKTVWLAGNNTVGTANQLSAQGCLLLGDWLENDCLSAQAGFVSDEKCLLKPLDLDRARLIVFTSGSSGEAKLIHKTLRQLNNEIVVLEQQWGQLLDTAQVLSTVSQQHIYGLLFRVLWPIAAGRCFNSELFLNPEVLLKENVNQTAYWVASPAQLKRLDEKTDWQELAMLKAVFSSGGALPINSAKQIYDKSQHQVIEVYGSSETGGIAWRQSVSSNYWTLFTGLELAKDDNEHMQLFSPFLKGASQIKLDDKIELKNQSQFVLLGRTDRIVKVEEKRLSLNELESSLNQSTWVMQSHTLLLSGKRDVIAAVLVLTKVGGKFLKEQGKSELTKQLRKSLMQHFETVTLPKKWLFIKALPMTVQGKINRSLLIQLFTLGSDHFPYLQFCDVQQNQATLHLKAQADLVYFDGHFPGQPILPGVTQLAWVQRFGYILFNIQLPFLRMEVIKFKKIIRPDCIIQMKLDWHSESGKLYFDLRSDEDLFSSGRMVYGVH